MSSAAIALGSNLGDRRAHLDFAAARLRALLGGLTISAYYDTEPVGAHSPQPRYLNACAVGETTVPARELLAALLRIELDAGRERPHPNAPRTLDLDLLFYGDTIIDEPGLIIPHPRLRERRFVLEPLASIAPAMRDPISGRTVVELLAALD